MNRGAENYQANKTRTRQRPQLSREQMRQFLTFVAEARGTGDFELHLGLDRVDIAWLKDRLGVDSSADAKEFLKDFEDDDRMRELEAENRRAAAARGRQAQEQRLDARAARKQLEQDARRSKVKDLLDPDKLKREDKERQARHAARSEPVIEEKEDAWRLNEDDCNPEQFKTCITHYGMRFTRDRFGITNEDIKREAARLGLRIDWELVRR